MENLVDEILNKLKTSEETENFLDVLFKTHKEDVLHKNRKVVIFGAGDLGEEIYNALFLDGVSPSFFCDNDLSKSGKIKCGIPIIDFTELVKFHKDCIVIIASLKYLKAINKQLLESGFHKDDILCSEKNEETSLIYMYCTVGTQNLYTEYKKQNPNVALYDLIERDKDKIVSAYNLLADQKSKDMFICKMSLMISDRSYSLFREFILNFSEPLNEFDFFEYTDTPEDYYYFNSDVFEVSENEVYVDVGAYDGDSVETFFDAVEERKLSYKHIYAFEPDPNCYNMLVKKTKNYEKITNLQLGLWSEPKILKFLSSTKVIHDQAGAISTNGDIEIEVTSLDTYFKNKEVTLIKMDPAGNIIPEILKGSESTIKIKKPKLVLGAYHGFESIYEIPNLINSYCPDYKLFLRHNTFHLCDSAIYAIV